MLIYNLFEYRPQHHTRAHTVATLVNQSIPDRYAYGNLKSRVAHIKTLEFAYHRLVGLVFRVYTGKICYRKAVVFPTRHKIRKILALPVY